MLFMRDIDQSDGGLNCDQIESWHKANNGNLEILMWTSPFDLCILARRILYACLFHVI